MLGLAVVLKLQEVCSSTARRRGKDRVTVQRVAVRSAAGENDDGAAVDNAHSKALQEAIEEGIAAAMQKLRQRHNNTS